MGVSDYKNHIPKNCKLISSEYIDKERKRLYVKLECDKHGIFEIRSDDLKFRGCKKCKREKDKKIYDDQWKIDCSIIHNGKYDYSETEVGDVLSKSSIKCKECNVHFKQTPASHKSGQGCPTCGIKKMSLSSRKTLQDVQKSLESYGKNFDLSLANYITCKDKITIICDKGHTFEKTPDQIFNSYTQCSICSRGYRRSRGEKELFDFLSQFHKCENSNRKILNGLEIDVFIPEIRLGVEYNGLYWHNDERAKVSHFDKKVLANKNGIHMIHIYEDDWKFRKTAVKNKLVDTLHVREPFYIYIYPGTYDIIKSKPNEELIDIYNNSCIDPEIRYNGFYVLKRMGQILGIASFFQEGDKISIRQIMRNYEKPTSNYYELFLDYFIQHEKTFNFYANIDWLDNLYLSQRGVVNYESVHTTKKRHIINNKSYLTKQKENSKTITKSGYALFKL